MKAENDNPESCDPGVMRLGDVGYVLRGSSETRGRKGPM
jgi:hypothetical protein